MVHKKYNETKQPKFAVKVNTIQKPHISPAVNPAVSEKPKEVKASHSFQNLVTWDIKKADKEGKWSWHECRQWTVDEWNNDIEPLFKDFCQKTWSQIDQLSSGSGHKMHHSQEVADLIKEAQKRWKKLKLEQFDTVFRFRLSNKKRAWGYVLQSCFFFVWWERHHKIYPTKR